MTDNTNYLNSTKVINRFISKLSDLQDYSKAEMHKNHEAATLQLKSYTWNFDIVPCFYTDTGSYLLECMILQKYENKEASENWWIDLEFRDLLNYLSSAILSDVDDPKGIQGNLNSFCWDDRCKISDALTNAYNKAVEASNMELNDKNQKGAITKWGEVLGSDFPEYTGE